MSFQRGFIPTQGTEVYGFASANKTESYRIEGGSCVKCLRIYNNSLVRVEKGLPCNHRAKKFYGKGKIILGEQVFSTQGAEFPGLRAPGKRRNAIAGDEFIETFPM